MRAIQFASAAAVGIFIAIAAHPQSSRPQFEAAWLRLSPNQNVGRPGLLYTLPGGRMTANGILLRVLIFKAYDLHRDHELVGCPDWMNTMRWDLDAQATGDPDDARMMLMLQSLLEEKLSLKVHWDIEEPPADGFKLESSKGPVEVLVIDSVGKPTDN